MRKKFIRTTFVAAIAMVCGINVFSAQKSVVLSDVLMANVEALAQDVNDLCPNGCLDNGKGCYCNDWYPLLKEAGPVIGEEEEGD